MPRQRGRASGLIGRIVGWLFALAFLLVAASVVWVFAYKFVNPPATWLTLRDSLAGHSPQQTWVPLSRIDKHMPQAIITAEDKNFCSHNGFDIDAMTAAMQKNMSGKKLRGGSTVSQQTAKNVFLWPDRSYVRKGLEAWFTFLIEQLWGKRRIMEVYLNVVEIGINTYGVEAGAQRYFRHGAQKLTKREAARLAAILPSPIKRDAKRPVGYTKKYARNIEKWIRVVQEQKLDGCLAE